MSSKKIWTLARISKPRKGKNRGGAVHLHCNGKLLCKTRHKAEYLREIRTTAKNGPTCRTCIAMARLQNIEIAK